MDISYRSLTKVAVGRHIDNECWIGHQDLQCKSSLNTQQHTTIMHHNNTRGSEADN